MTNTEPGRAGALTALTDDECRELLDRTFIGRIAYVNHDGQQLVPVNFILLDGMIYFRTAYSGLLSELGRGHDDVAFEVDGHEDASRTGWNVTARGSARRVEDRATINKVLGNAKLRPWAEGVRSTVIEVNPRSLAGRAVR